jgi:hypothetical protein
MRPMRSVARLVFCLAAAASAACAPEIGGRASFPLLSRRPLPAAEYEKVATVDEQRCAHLVLFLFGWGDDANHEALVSDILAEHRGDLITDANLTFTQIPALFYYRTCAHVEGTVLRKKGASAPAPAPAAAEPVKP